MSLFTVTYVQTDRTHLQSSVNVQASNCYDAIQRFNGLYLDLPLRAIKVEPA